MFTNKNREEEERKREEKKKHWVNVGVKGLTRSISHHESHTWNLISLLAWMRIQKGQDGVNMLQTYIEHLEEQQQTREDNPFKDFHEGLKKMTEELELGEEGAEHATKYIKWVKAADAEREHMAIIRNRTDDAFLEMIHVAMEDVDKLTQEWRAERLKEAVTLDGIMGG